MAKNNSINNLSGFLTIDPLVAGDSFIQFDVNTSNQYRIGVDDSAGDSFKISQGGALGTNDQYIMDSAGQITLPLQPAFLVYLNGSPTNVTGNSVAYTIAYDAEVYDIGNNFSSTTFTAPVAGLYHFVLSIEVTPAPLSAARTVVAARIIGSTFGTHQNNSYATTSNSNHIDMELFVNVAASETVTTQVIVVGGTQTVGIQGNSGTGGFITNYFSGRLVE
jgi:hypothetical protein